MPDLLFRARADYDELIGLREEITKLENRLKTFGPGSSTATIKAMETQLESARMRFNGLARDAAQAGASLDFNIRKGANGAIDAINDLQAKLSNPIQGLAQIAGVAGLGAFLNKAAQVRGEFQLMETNINTLLGSAEKGKAMMADLTEYAKESPLDFKGTVGAARMMLGFGIEQQKVLPFMKALGDVSMGNARNFNSLTLAFSQMSAAGKLMGQDLMQMVNAGFQPLDQLAKDTGKSIGQLKDEMSQGKISAEMVQQAFLNATKEGGKYYNMSAAATATISGQMSMLGDAVDLMFNDLGRGMEDNIIKVIDGATRMVEHYKEIGGVLGTAISAFGIYKASMMASEFAVQKTAEERSAAIVSGFQEEIAKMEEYRRERELLAYDDDVRGALQTGSISSDMADRIQELREEMETRKELAQVAVEAAQKEHDALQESLDKAQEKVDQAQELVDYAEQIGDAQEQAAAAIELAARESERDAIATEVDAAAKRIDTAQTELDTVTTQANTVSQIQQTNATNANTTAQTANTAATGRGRIATALHTAGNKVATVVQHGWNAAVNAGKKAIDSLKLAFMSNPFGMVLTALTTAAGLFMTFRDSSEEATAEVERFGEEAAKTRRNVATLYDVIESVDKGSKVYRDSIDELMKSCRDYGIQIKDEQDLLEHLSEIRARHNELIEKEGEARQTANRIASYEKDKADAEEAFVKKMSSELKDGSRGDAKDGADRFARIIADTVDRKAAELRPLLDELDALQKAYGLESTKGQYANGAKMAEMGRKMADLQKRITDSANEDALKYAESMGVADEYGYAVGSVSKAVGSFVRQLTSADEFLEMEKKNAQEAKEAIERAKDAAPTPEYNTFDPKKLTEELVKATQEVDRLNSKKIKPIADPVEIESLIKDAEKASEKIGDVDSATASPSTDNTDLEETERQGQKAEDKLKDIDNSVATPVIDTRYLDIALSKLDDLKVSLRDVGGQVLNTSGDERRQLKELVDKYGENGKIKAGTKMTKDDYAVYKRIVENSRRRSYLSVEGSQMHLDREQSAVMQQLYDRYGTDLGAAEMTKADKRLYDQLQYDVMLSSYNKDKGKGGDAVKAIKGAIEKRISEARTTEDFSSIRKSINEQMQKVDQGGELYGYFERQLKALDRRDKTKKGNDDPRQREYERRKAQKEEERRTAEMLQAERDREYQLELDRRQDSTDKEIDTIRFEARKKRNALLEERRKEAERLKEFDRQQWLKGGKDRKAYQWTQSISDDDYLTRASENIGYTTQLQGIALEEDKGVRKATEEAEAAMREHLRRYGTYAERLKAINEDFTAKIGKARTEGERLTLQKEWEDAKEELRRSSDGFLRAFMDTSGLLEDIARRQAEEMVKARGRGVSGIELAQIRSRYDEERRKAVADGIDGIRMDDGQSLTEMIAMLGTAQKESLEALRTKVEEYAGTHAEDLGAEGQKKVGDILSQIDDAIAARGDRWKNFIGGIPAAFDSFKDTRKKLKDAKAAYDKAFDVKMDAESERDTRRNDLVDMLKKLTGKGEEEIAQSVNSGTVTQDFSSIISPEDMKGVEQAQQAFAGASEAAAEAGAAAAGAAEGVGAAAGASAAAGAALTDAIIHGVNDNLQSVPELIDQLGLNDSDFGKGMKDFAESSQYATQAFDAFKSGNFVGVATNLINALGSLGNSIGQFFGGRLGGLFGESDIRLAEDMERLAESNSDLRKAIDKLADGLRDASTADSLSIYREEVANMKELMESTRDIMARAGSAYNNGFLGIGGKGSSNSRINSHMDASDWAKVSKAAGTSVRSASDFWRLTSEQMANVAKHATAQWTAIRMYADEGYADASQYMDEYIGYYEELDALQEAYREKLTDTSWDSVTDSFKSMLLNMESDSQDFADSFEEMMRQAVINSLMDSIFNTKLKDWYEQFSDYMETDEGRLTSAHQEQLRLEYDRIAKEAIAMRDSVAEALDWDTSLNQKGASNSFSGMSQNTGDAIEGRLTAIYMALMDVRNSHMSDTPTLQSISDNTAMMLERQAEDSRIYNDILLCANRCYLELVGIQQNTGAVVAPIRDMADRMAEIEKRLRNL